MKIGILGGGFGLYGWLPAICQHYPNSYVFLESKHKDKFYNRNELITYLDKIVWNNCEEIINQCELLIIAIPPFCVYDYLNLILNSNSIKKIIVEKPICETPIKSEKFYTKIENKGIKICSSYLFFYTDWFQIFLDKIKNFTIHIEWNIINKNNNWKLNQHLGGGPLKFYGIHLLSILAFFNYSLNNIIKSNSECFEASFINDTNLIFTKINLSNHNLFTINDFIKKDNPFGIQDITNDFRISPIKTLLSEFESEYSKLNFLMKKTNDLWAQIER